ncbi:hypothetical protein OFD51_30855, partial [Escherichia coli]|nr:hypothetical protein [Escherichia coli]
MKLELMKKGLLFPAYLSFFFGGVVFFLIVLGVLYIMALLLNAEFVNREIGLPIRDQLWVIGKYALAGFTAATAGYLAGF